MQNIEEFEDLETIFSDQKTSTLASFGKIFGKLISYIFVASSSIVIALYFLK
jgi:hypothetical protein